VVGVWHRYVQREESRQYRLPGSPHCCPAGDAAAGSTAREQHAKLYTSAGDALDHTVAEQRQPILAV